MAPVTLSQLMALSLVSTQPIETSCGKYDVAVTLAGEQPTTTMKIVRTKPWAAPIRRRWPSMSRSYSRRSR
ncbi:MAG TPA: hypothetical protein VGP73_06795, partial [Thermoanaerobaculia bacterium]